MYDQAQNLRDMVSKKDAVRVISIASGKGGVGKSSISVNLAIALSRLGKNVLVVDADFGLANVDIMLGVTSKYDVCYFKKKKKSLNEIVQLGHANVQFISGGSGVNTLLNMTEEQLSRLMLGIIQLERPIDVIILDTGAGINDNVLQIILASNETIVISTSEPTAILDAYALVKSIVKLDNSHPLHVLINNCVNVKEARNAQEGFINVVGGHLGKNINPIGLLMHDQNIPLSIKRQLPVLISEPYGQTSRDLDTIARALLNMPVNVRSKNILSGIFSRLLGK
jgi:flagellar biosynthesis protein FlhG